MKQKELSEFEISRLLYKQLTGGMTAEETKRLEEWKAASPGNQLLFERLSDPSYLKKEFERLDGIDAGRPAEEMRSRIKASSLRQRPFRLYAVRHAAAAMLAALLLGSACYLYLNRQPDREETPVAEVAAPLPGGAKALLTLEDGSTLELDGETHVIETDGQPSVSIGNGELAYKQEKAKEGTLQYNELRIPQGGEYRLRLSDGTEICLNADSYLRYPKTFGEGERRVTLEGEAYFKVAPDAARPFIVETAAQQVRVLGTEFNVSAYRDEADILTTLLKGSVAVQTDKADAPVRLQPGEQCRLDKASSLTTVRQVDAEAVAAWTKGLFVLENQTLEQIMRNLSRWYAFRYRITSDELARRVFKGSIPRYSDFGKAKAVLEECGEVSISIKENEIIVSKN